MKANYKCASLLSAKKVRRNFSRGERRGEVGGANLHIGRERTCHTSYLNVLHVLPTGWARPTNVNGYNV